MIMVLVFSSFQVMLYLFQNRRLARLLGVEVPALPAELLPRLLVVQVLVWVQVRINYFFELL